MDTVMTAATGAISSQQVLLLAGFATVVVAGITVTMTLWGIPKAVRFFKRVAS